MCHEISFHPVEGIDRMADVRSVCAPDDFLLSYSNQPLKIYQGPVVQSIVRLTSSLVVKMLTVLVSTISNSQVFLLKKCE